MVLYLESVLKMVLSNNNLCKMYVCNDYLVISIYIFRLVSNLINIIVTVVFRYNINKSSK